MSIRRDIEWFIRIYPSRCRSSYVTNCISASLAGGDLIPFQLCPQLGGSVTTNIVNLNILTCGSVQRATSIFVRYVGNPAYLFRSKATIGQLDPDHLYTLLTLAINSSH